VTNVFAALVVLPVAVANSFMICDCVIFPAMHFSLCESNL
jgi:hypothetical protein